jgi:heme/copper-type cytochrome/quinol oxidase subunit 2
VRYRARPDSPRPADAPIPGTVTPERGTVLFSWIIALVIAVIMFGLAFSTIHAVDAIENPPPDEPSLHYNVTGFQFGWKYNYTGEGGVNWQNVSDWTVPADTVVIMNITSQDVWHNFAFPNFRIRVDAIPGEVNHLWFKAKETGEERNACVQICGAGHAGMKAVMHVVTPAEYARFLHDSSMEQYAKLAKKSQVNATFDGTSLNVSALAKAASALSITNNGPSAATFSVDGAYPVTVQPGQSGLLYVPTGAGHKLVASNGATQAVS